MRPILPVVLVLAAAFCCDASETRVRYSAKRVRELLTDQHKPNVTETARILRLAVEDGKILNGVSAFQLKRLAMFSDILPLDNCHRGKFDQFEEIKRKVSENVYLANYCEKYINDQYERCANAPADKLFARLVKSLPSEELLSHSTFAISQYIIGVGEEEDPLEINIKGYLKTLKRKERNAYKAACLELDSAIETDLFFFDRDGTKREELLKQADVEKCRVRECCEQVKKLVS